MKKDVCAVKYRMPIGQMRVMRKLRERVCACVRVCVRMVYCMLSCPKPAPCATAVRCCRAALLLLLLLLLLPLLLNMSLIIAWFGANDLSHAVSPAAANQFRRTSAMNL